MKIEDAANPTAFTCAEELKLAGNKLPVVITLLAGVMDIGKLYKAFARMGLCAGKLKISRRPSYIRK